MKPTEKKKKTIWVIGALLVGAIVAVVLVLAVFQGGNGKSESERALDAAQQWTQDGIDDVSEDIVKFAIGEIPLVAELVAELLEDRINDVLTWEYSMPEMVTSDIYQLTAESTVSLEFTLPIIGQKIFDIVIPIDLTVDVNRVEVTEASFNISDASIDERQ